MTRVPYLTPVPDPAPVEPPLLSKVQWKFFLYVTGFDQAAASALTAMPKTTPQQIATWAGMKAVIEDSAYYRLSVATRTLAQFIPSCGALQPRGAILRIAHHSHSERRRSLLEEGCGLHPVSVIRLQRAQPAAGTAQQPLPARRTIISEG